MSKKAVLLLSGGLDSATVGAIATSQGYTVHALSFRYGQRHAVELTAAANIANHLGVAEHKIADIDLRLFGGSALTDNIAVPKHEQVEDIGQDIPVTYVPARNTIFLSFALAWAETLKAYDILSASMRWITAAIPIAAPISSPPTKLWRISPQRMAWKISSASAFTPRLSASVKRRLSRRATNWGWTMPRPSAVMILPLKAKPAAIATVACCEKRGLS